MDDLISFNFVQYPRESISGLSLQIFFLSKIPILAVQMKNISKGNMLEMKTSKMIKEFLEMYFSHF